MSNQEKVTINERYKYLRMMKKRYQRANKQEKGRLLAEMEEITGQHHKSLIRAMNGHLERQPRCQQRGNSYGPEVDDALRVIAESMDYICAERLTPCLVPIAQQLAKHGELQLNPQLVQALAEISVSTVRRHLQHLSQDQPKLSNKKASAGKPLTRDIPMKRIPRQQDQPGHIEVDLVHHCGDNASGEYLHTLQLIDVATGWSERVAVLGRSFRVMEAGFKHCFCRLPFVPLEFHSDNGSEFLNQHLLRFLREAYPEAIISRSRPYQKNDNRLVEQKNASLVRAYLGYDRFDTVQHANLLNRIYDKMWWYYNFCQPVMRLQGKKTITTEDGSIRIKRAFDKSQTPFDRLCATKVLSEDEQRRWQTLREQINPRQLRREIQALLDQFFSLPRAVPGVSENVFDTFPIPLTILKGEDFLVTLSSD